jgi:hypothetical protein
MVKGRIALLFAVALQCANAKEPKQYFETPRQEFFALGGKETPAKVIVRGNDLTTLDIAEGRDLSQYVNGGSFDSGFNGRRNPSKIRQFIWNCWHHRHRGYIRDSSHSIDASGTSHIFVEPAADGHWHVAWRIVRSDNTISDMPDTVSVTWQPRKRGDRPGEHILVFRHRDDYEIQRL